MYTKNTVTAQQKHGIIVCLPKREGAQKPTDFSPITLLNVDYKILTKILVNPLRPLLAEHLQKNQFCGVQGKTILDALATVRDTTAMAEVKTTPVCLVSLDFQEEFDRISHTCLATILKSYGLSDWFVDQIRTMYEGAHSSVSINGHISGPIPIRCGIRQGCPLSMILFAMCIQPLLQMLDRNLSGVQLRRTRHRTAVIAHADDVTVFVTKPEDFRIIQDAVRCFEKASGAHLNITKSKAIAIGGWETSRNDLGVKYHQTVKILRIHFRSTMERTMYEKLGTANSED
jgi:hypothetical protein